MTRSRTRGSALLAVALLAAALLAAACDTGPTITPLPSGGDGPVPPTLAPEVSERPFERAAWPEDGSACGMDGYAGLLGRVEAVAARTVRFTLCRPDAAFPARLAHPALGILDAAMVALVEADPAAARGAAGAGAFRVEAWSSDDGAVRLVRVDGGGAAIARVVLRWAGSSSARVQALRDATVDGIDDPSAGDVAGLETLPELVVRPRAGLATAYLGFGSPKALNRGAVRRAFAQALDREALARDAFPPGSVAATHLSPCGVTGGCAGLPWYEFNGPAGAAALALAEFDTEPPIPLLVPDGPVAGLPDPLAAADAVAAQLAASLGVTIEVEVVPVAALEARIAAGEVAGLYLWGVASPLADASGFLGPLVGDGAAGTPGSRAKGAAAALATAAATLAPGARVAAFAEANDAVRASAAIVPLVHPGTATAWRADAEGVVVSALGVDPLGDARPGDRRQIVVMGTAEPAAAWCAVAPDLDALRLCGLVTPGLYAFPGGGLDAQPALAERCTASIDARTWTCRLGEGLRFANGMRLDAGDVLASIRAQADAGGPLRAALPAGRFAAWDALFGAPVPAGP